MQKPLWQANVGLFLKSVATHVDYNQRTFKYLEPPTNQVSMATNCPSNSYPPLLDQMDGVGYMNMAHC
jgi:hypothetical protein